MQYLQKQYIGATYKTIKAQRMKGINGSIKEQQEQTVGRKRKQTNELY